MRRFSVWFGLVLGSLALYWVLRSVEWSRVAEVLSRANHSELILAFLTLSLAPFAMALRWKLLIAAPRGTFSVAFKSLLVALLVNNVLPGRLGEAVRPFLVAHETKGASAYLIAKALLDRVFDVAFLGSWGATAVLFTSTSDRARQVVLWSMLALGGVVLIVILLRTPQLQRRLALRETSRDGARYRLKLLSLLENFQAGLRDVSGITWLGLGMLTLVAWSLIGASFYWTLSAFSISLRFWDIVQLGVLLNLGALVPALPGQIGTYQLIGVFILQGLGLEKEAAVSFALAHHVLWYVPTTLGGAIVLALGYNRSWSKWLRELQESGFEKISES